MFHFAPRTFTHALVMAGFVSATAAVPQIHAAQEPKPAPPAAAPQAQQSTPDAEIVAKIRKDLTDDKNLASYASTLKVIVSGGLVTLKGAVRSEDDKKAIEQIAARIAGEANVMNNLFVSSEQPVKPQTP